MVCLIELAMIVHAYNSRIWEDESGRLQIWGQPGLHSKILSKKMPNERIQTPPPKKYLTCCMSPHIWSVIRIGKSIENREILQGQIHKVDWLLPRNGGWEEWEWSLVAWGMKQENILVPNRDDVCSTLWIVIPQTPHDRSLHGYQNQQMLKSLIWNNIDFSYFYEHSPLYFKSSLDYCNTSCNVNTVLLHVV
jgi:hypothetical protein